jgi:hypothetical protein
MPNYDPAHPGNALLVLLVYDESPAMFFPCSVISIRAIEGSFG